MTPQTGITVASAVLAAAAGVAAGYALSPTPEPETITETVTETITETVADVPDACIAALDGADVILDVSADFATLMMELMGDVMPASVTAAFAHDASGLDAATADLERITGDIDDLTARLSGSTYGSDAAACRAAAR